MTVRRRFSIEAIAATAGLLVLAGVIAPFVRINQFSDEIRGALEHALHRKVEIGEARMTLFTGPGLSVENVTVYDIPEAGLEPFAYMRSMKVTFSLRSLWTQRLEISSIYLEEPSINLVKIAENGGWNIQQLVRQSAAGSAPGHLPTIHIDAGRINFKFGDTKSSFYLSDASVEVRPRISEPGALLVEFEAAPARTDRAGQGFGRFSGRGRWIASPEGSRVSIDAELESTYVDELAVLFQGRSLGLHGLVSGNAKIFGPAVNPQLLGTITLEDLHRWDIIQAHSGSAWSANFEGTWNLVSGTVELNAAKHRNPGSPVALRLLVNGLQSQPEWVAEAAIEGWPAPALLGFVRNLGAPLPAGLSANGTVNGMIGYASTRGLQGQLNVEAAELGLENGPRFEMPRAEVVVLGDELRLLPATLAATTGTAQVEASYAPLRQYLTARISGRDLRMNLLQGGANGLFPGTAIPYVQRLQGGTWSGHVAYSSAGAGEPDWRAQLELRNSAVRIAGVAEPVQLERADLSISGGNASFRSLRGSVGAVPFRGAYVARDSTAPDTVELRFEQVTLPQLEAMLMPVLRREPGFFARTLPFRRDADAPAWLKSRRIKGTIRAAELTAGEVGLSDVSADLFWNGSQVTLTALEARYGSAQVQAEMTADLSSSLPRYALGARISDLPWRNGLVELRTAAETAGTGSELMLNLRSEGSFEIRSSALSPEYALRTATGTFGLAWTRNGPRLKLTGVQASIDGERFLGEGATKADGHLQVELASDQRVMKLAGSLAPLKLEVTADRTPAR